MTNTPAAHERFPSWSPDGKWIAYFSDESGEYALHIVSQSGSGAVKKINLGNPPSFFYGPTWSPDSKKIAYYRFDESKVPDYFLQLGQTELQSKMDIEAYPKAGAPNPVVDLFVYDENDHLVCRSTASADREYCRLWPRWTGPFRIEVQNLGAVADLYRLATN